MNILFKETKDLDYEQVVDIFFEADFLKHLEKRKIYKKAIEKAFHNSQYVASAWNDKELVGFIRVLTDGELYATLWNLIVRKKYRRRGIGKKLMNKCLEKYPNIHFFLFANEEVEDFHKKLGFDKHKHGMYLVKGIEFCVIYN